MSPLFLEGFGVQARPPAASFHPFLLGISAGFPSGSAMGRSTDIALRHASPDLTLLFLLEFVL